MPDLKQAWAFLENSDGVASAGDVQPDSFSCEAELGYRFARDRLPGIGAPGIRG